MPLRRTITGDVDIQGTADGVARSIRAIESSEVYAFGRPTPIVSTSGYKARLGDLVRLNMSAGALTIKLPAVRPQDVGKSITLLNTTGSTNTLTVLSPGGTINGASAYSLSRRYFRRTLIAAAERKWVDDISSAVDSDGAPYLTTSMPTGVTTPPVALYQFDGTAAALTDRSGNGNTLTRFVGSSEPYNVYNGVVGANFSTWAARSSADSSFQLTGAMTLEIDMIPQDFVAAPTPYRAYATCGYTSTWASSADNFLWGVWTSSTTATGQGWAKETRSFHQAGSGPSNYEVLFPEAYIQRGQRLLYTQTRASNGTDYTVYIDGVEAGSGTAGGAPDGGGSTVLSVGHSSDGGWPSEAIIFSVRLTPVEFSADQVLEAYQGLAR